MQMTIHGYMLYHLCVGLLEEPKTITDPSALKAVKDVYTACMNEGELAYSGIFIHFEHVNMFLGTCYSSFILFTELKVIL